uniref:Uncharacterized protein n=1 Tax=Oryza rufipogon TaxID=4529 RepID=A0A0E0PWV2_ORYRU
MVEEPEDAAPVVLRSDTTNEAEDAPAYITLAATRRVSRVTVPRSAHPHRGADYDKRSFIIVADPAGLVIHQYDAPAFGFNISDDLWGNLFMLLECSFVPIGSGELDMPTAILIPDYVEPAIQYICNIKNVRLISHPSSNGVDAEYIIVELWIGFSAEHGKLRYVEICKDCIDHIGATVLIVQTLATSPDDTWWKDTYWTNFKKIWTSQSYKATGMRWKF